MAFFLAIEFSVEWEFGPWSQWTKCDDDMQTRERETLKVGNLKQIPTQEMRVCEWGKNYELICT